MYQIFPKPWSVHLFIALNRRGAAAYSMVIFVAAKCHPDISFLIIFFWLVQWPLSHASYTQTRTIEHGPNQIKGRLFPNIQHNSVDAKTTYDTHLSCTVPGVLIYLPFVCPACCFSIAAFSFGKKSRSITVSLNSCERVIFVHVLSKSSNHMYSLTYSPAIVSALAFNDRHTRLAALSSIKSLIFKEKLWKMARSLSKEVR